jgi:hypothetical protein
MKLVNSKINTDRLNHSLLIGFILIMVLVVADRWILLEEFAFRFVDDDQSIMWYGAREMALGHFHEPCFYGQNYNSMLESLLAVPFIKSGISYYIALPLITSLLALMPYFIISIILWFKNKKTATLLVISIPLLLPHEFGMITSIPRGFVTGVFVASLAALSMFSNKKITYFFASCLSGLALWLNPNSLLLVLPVLIFLVLKNYKKPSFYFLGFLGALPPAIMFWLTTRFYQAHPDYIVHRAWDFHFSTSILKISSVISYFDDISPVFWKMGWMVLLIWIVVVFILFRQKEIKAAFAFSAALLLLLFSLGIDKINDGYPTVFYSWSRMFIAVPLLLGVFVAKIRMNVKPHLVMFLLLIPVVFFGIKCVTVSSSVRKNTNPEINHNVYISSVFELKDLCSKINSAAKNQKADLIVVGNYPTKHLVNYGCPCLEEDFPVAIEPALDRRVWLLKEEENKKRGNILFTSIYADLFTEQLKINLGIFKISETPMIYMMNNNSMKTFLLLDSINMPLRLH